MKFDVYYFVVDKGDNNYEKHSTIEAKTDDEMRQKLLAMNKGKHVHTVRATVIDEPKTEPQEDIVPREKCDKCNTPLNDGGTCPKCDDGEEDYGDLREARETISPEEFFGMCCSAQDDEIMEICKQDKDPKKFYHRFGKDHSYIMGAIRNGNWSTAKILLAFGAKFAPNEASELAYMLIREKLG